MRVYLGYLALVCVRDERESIMCEGVDVACMVRVAYCASRCTCSDWLVVENLELCGNIIISWQAIHVISLIHY